MNGLGDMEVKQKQVNKRDNNSCKQLCKTKSFEGTSGTKHP